MIKANQLRIGNYVNVPRSDQSPFRIDAFESLSEKIIKVAMIHPVHGENFHPLTWYGVDLQPIPLTEEILLKCGFYYNAATQFNYKGSTIKCFKVGIYLWFQNGWFVKLTDKIGSFNILNENVFYLHQLQNLYFALTGEELKINL